MNYAKAIRIARSIAGISQKKLADRTGLDRSYLSLIEGEKRKPTVDTIQNISNALNMPFHLLTLLATEKIDTTRIDESQVINLATELTHLLLESGEADEGGFSDKSDSGEPTGSEFRLEIKRSNLNELLTARDSLYRPFTMPKKQHPYPGRVRLLGMSKAVKFRRIDNPVAQLKHLQRLILRRILSEVELPPYMFGAVSGKTLVLHAERHTKNQASALVSMDISSYYPSVTCAHVYFVWSVILGCPPPVARLLTQLTTFEWHLPQGAPTSPAIANILLGSIYAPICLASEKAGLEISTWVDDLIFSGTRTREVMETVRSTLASNGFKDAREKRVILGPRDQKVFTGTRLGRFQPRASHKAMSDLRAAIHRLAISDVSSEEIDKYRSNLSGRIAHLASINKGDANKLKRQAKDCGVLLKA